MTAPDHVRLACRTCRWVPDPALPMGLIEAHVSAEHPEQVKSDGSPDVHLDMVVVCTRCQQVVPRTKRTDRGDHWDLRYDCERCHRTYRFSEDKR